VSFIEGTNAKKNKPQISHGYQYTNSSRANIQIIPFSIKKTCT